MRERFDDKYMNCEKFSPIFKVATDNIRKKWLKLPAQQKWSSSGKNEP